MTHIWGHIECGSVGDLVGTEDRVWPFVDKFIVASRLNGAAAEDMQLDRKILLIMKRMAAFAEDIHGADSGPVEILDGGYRAIIVGTKLGDIPMIALPVHTDALFTYAMNVIGRPHAEQSFIKNELDIMRYEAYSLIYGVTGGEIHHNSYHP